MIERKGMRYGDLEKEEVPSVVVRAPCCRDLNITPNNLCVMLHRARMALRECLEINWYKKVPAKAE
jgi:hypothetical protein